MSDHPSTFSQLMNRLGQGSQDAAWELIEVYGPHVQRYVRRTLTSDLRSKFDSIDFAQIVWASFFREPQRIRQLTTPQQLLAYLASMARNKVIDESRRRLDSQKHNVRREVSLEQTDPEAARSLHSHDPSPSSVAVARERWSRLVEAQPEDVRRILELRFQGETYCEIARRMHVNERTVRRAIARLVDLETDADLVDAEVS
ncbi:MAG TPA: RNA polymerase sigma factor [Pirellulaceae bacterium]|jgi:RNA polymerase sigma-70 factor, ECF subfamily|nr:RNA polymerase sigma factor [Pirellulaceae bacterium]